MKKLDVSEGKIEQWLRDRREQDKPSSLDRFYNVCWLLVYHFFSFTFGLIVLWNKSWMWNYAELWNGYPHQSLDTDILWYYLISIGFNLSITYSLLFDLDYYEFWKVAIHHTLTLVLLTLSFICNWYRIGSLLILLHDASDICLDAAKVAKYSKYDKASNTIFVIFFVVWMATRIGLYSRIVYSSSVEAPSLLPMFPVYYIFNSLLLMLFVLHCVWTRYIFDILWRVIIQQRIIIKPEIENSNFGEKKIKFGDI